MNESEIVALPRLPEATDTPVIVELKPERVTVKLPGPAPAVLPAKPKVTCVPDKEAEPDKPLPLPHKTGGPTQKLGPDTPTVKGPTAPTGLICVLPVVDRLPLKLPLRAALAFVAESRHRSATAVHMIAPRLVLLAAGFRNRIFVPSLIRDAAFRVDPTARAQPKIVDEVARCDSSWWRDCPAELQLSGSTLGDRGPQLSHPLRCFTLPRSSLLLPAIAPPSPTSGKASIRKHTCLRFPHSGANQNEIAIACCGLRLPNGGGP